ncbi:MAG: hypothetical protein IRY90_06890 [Actinomadura rubrobrunea]|nr:hypothetical protein [Actinomadura rubrobrunea]
MTSRNRLSGLVALDGATPIELDRPGSAEAVALLRRVLGDEQVDAEPEAALELADRCACLPLALRVAAERAAARPPFVSLADVAAELADERSRLDLLDADDERTAVRDVFSWSYAKSYAKLAPETARAFRLLALHPGPEIGVRAAAALLGEPLDDTRRLLTALVRVHLLEECGRERYRYHDLLRIYAAERAREEAVEQLEICVGIDDRHCQGWCPTGPRYAHAGLCDYPRVPPLLPRSPRRHPPYRSVGRAYGCQRIGLHVDSLRYDDLAKHCSASA